MLKFYGLLIHKSEIARVTVGIRQRLYHLPSFR